MTFATNEPNRVYRVHGDFRMKWLVTPLTGEMLPTLTIPTSGNLFPYFHDLLAGGMLTCVTETGQERDIKVFQKELWDLPD